MPRVKPPTPHNDGKWTDSRKKSFITSALRGASNRWGPKHTALRRARIGYGRYRCELCGAVSGPKGIHLDHIQPVVDPAVGFQGWDTFVARLFVEADGYRAICKAKCHKAITEEQRLIRQEAKKNKQCAS